MNKNRILYYAMGLLTILHLSIAKAESTQNDLFGVWRGTLGQQEIMACWDQSGGNYYKLQQPLRIALNNAKNSNVWLENEWEKSEDTISWQLNKPIDDHLVGSQIISGTSTTLPIILNRIQSTAPDDENGCNFSGVVYDAFNTPRFTSTQIHYGEPSVFMNTKYHVINALNGNIASIELMGRKDSFAKANSVLHKEFMNDVLGYLTCDEFEPPRQGDYQSKIRLRFINDEWLSWSGHLEGYCGGAHPFFGSSTTTINLHTGHEINLWDWFNIVKKEEIDQENQDDDVDSYIQVCEFLTNRCLPRPLSELVINTPASYEDKDCKDINFHEMVDGGYSIGLNERGIAFIPDLAEPARGMRTCYANYTVPFAKLAPFLSKAGSNAINRILLHSSDITK